MADRKLSASTALTGAQVDAANDQLMILDVSDTTDGAGGTNKKITVGPEFLKLFRSYFRNVADTFTSIFQNANTAARTYTFQDRDGTIADVFIDKLIGATLNRRHLGLPYSANLGTVAATINSLRGYPVTIQNTVTIDKLGVYVSTGTSGKIRALIYDSSPTSGMPNNLIADSGELTITAPGVYEGLSVASVIIPPGLYHFCILTDTANTLRATGTQTQEVSYGVVSGSATVHGTTVIVAQAYGSAPNPFTAGAAISASSLSNVAVFYRAI